MLCLLVHKHAPETPLGYGYIRAPSAVLQTASICKLKASVMHDRVVLGLNSRHMTVPCPSPLKASVMYDRVVLGLNSKLL